MSGGELSSTSVLMAFPHVDIQMGTEGRVSLTHPVLETKVEGSSETLEAFRYFEKPKMLGEAVETGKVAPQILEQLLRAVLVVNVNLLVDQVPISIGRPVIFSDFVSAPPAKGAVAIIGAPVDIATTRDSGTRQGPTEVRFQLSADRRRIGGDPGSRLSPLLLEWTPCGRSRKRESCAR